MTQLGARPAWELPPCYKGFHLAQSHGRVYAIPPGLDPAEVHRSGRLLSHPAFLSAATVADLQAQIDGLDFQALRPEPLGACDGYRLVCFLGAVYGIPEAAGPVDLTLDEECRRAGVLRGRTGDEVRERIGRLRGTVPVEFAGWLPIYEASGNCGRHPQFRHTADPPPGYRFTCSAPPARTGPSLWERLLPVLEVVGQALLAVALLFRPLVALFQPGPRGGWRARARVLAALARLAVALRRNGGRLVPILCFLRTRHFRSQVLLGNRRDLVFLTSMPYTYGQGPWVVEIEDPTTLFYPHIQNGQTCSADLARSPYFPIVKTFLEHDSCKGVLTHMRSTAGLVRALFRSEAVSAKVRYVPLGVPLPARWQRHEESEPIDLLFINSWCQVPTNFYNRGGLDVLEAFATLKERYPQLRLTIRSHLPGLAPHYHRILESGWVRVIDRFLSAEEMDALLADSHIFLLPAARVHIVSLLQAMSYGLAVVASDGWGIEEYVEHGRNGLVVKGRYGKVSWADEEAGMLREDYGPMGLSDPEVVRGLVDAVSLLVEDRLLRRRLGREARRDVETQYNLERWNQGLKEAFDQALAAGPAGSEHDAAVGCLTA
jgi:glycosyltransferase involved in cell wall biosynthesis